MTTYDSSLYNIGKSGNIEPVAQTAEDVKDKLGFVPSYLEEPIEEDVVEEPTITPKQPTAETPRVEPAKVVEPQVIDRDALLSNIQGTFDKYGGTAGANEAFIQGVTKYARGNDATLEELASGGTIADVVNRLGVSEQLSGFGITEPDPEPKAGVVEDKVEEVSVVDQIRNLRASAKGLSEAQTTAEVAEAGERLRTAQLNVQELKNTITEQTDIDQDALEDLEGQGRGITSSVIGLQQSQMTKEQQRALRDVKQDYNNALMVQLIEQGAYTRAEQLAKDIAEDLRQDVDDEVELLLLENTIDQTEAKLLRDEAQTEYERLTVDQLTPITEAQASLLDPSKVVRVGGKIYKRPEVAVDLQYIPSTKTQAGGFFNKQTGAFTKIGSFVGASDSSGAVGAGLGVGDDGNVMEITPIVSGYVKLVNSGRLTAKQAIDEIPTANKAELINQLANTQSAGDTATDLVAKEKAQLALSLKDHAGLNSSVGTSLLTRGNKINWWDNLAGNTQSFIGDVEKLTSGLSLEALIEAKERGATFGALSTEEMKILSSSASNIGTWRVTDDKGRVIGYDIDEKRFKDELGNINKIVSRAIKSSIGSQDTSTADPLGILETSNSNNPLGL